MNSKKIRTLIVEDELYDRKLIEKILTEHYSEYIEIIDVVKSTEEAVTSIKSKHPQLVFLDIELNGERDGAFKILSRVEMNFKIVFVTAKNQQDDFLKAIRLSCIDYLVKPTKISDFEYPVKKAVEEFDNLDFNNTMNEIFKHNVSIKDMQESKISLQEGYSLVPTFIKNIIWCEAQGNYTKIYLVDGKNKLVNGNLKSLEDRLTGFGFCRTSKSEMINLSHILSFSRKNQAWEVKMSDKKIVYISAQRKQSFLMQYQELHF